MDLLAHRTAPRAALRVHLQIRFEIEALDVLAFLPSGRQRYPLEGDRTLERHLQRCLLHAAAGQLLLVGAAVAVVRLLAGAEVAFDLVGAHL